MPHLCPPDTSPQDLPVVQAWRTSNGQLYCRHSDNTYRVLLPYIAEGAEYELVRASGHGDLVYAISQRPIHKISDLEPRPPPPSTSILLGLVRAIGYGLSGLAFLVGYVLTFAAMMVFVPIISLISGLAELGQYNVVENAPSAPVHWSDRALTVIERKVGFFTKQPEDFMFGAATLGAVVYLSIAVVLICSWCGCGPGPVIVEPTATAAEVVQTATTTSG